MAAVEELAAGKGACAAVRCCPEAKPRAGPTSCLGLSSTLQHAQPATPALCTVPSESPPATSTP